MATITSLTFQMNALYNGDGIRQARRDMTRLDSSMNALSKSSSALVPGFKALVSTVLTLAPALIPISAGLLGIGAAAGAAFTLAGTAVGIYAVALKGAISSTVGQGSAVASTATKMQTAQKTMDNAVKGTKEYEKAQKALTEATKAHEEAIKALPPVQEEFARAYDGAKASLQDFNTENAKFTLRPATTMINAFIDALPKVVPLLKAMEPVVQGVADAFQGWVNDGGLERFIKMLVDYGVPALKNFIQAGANIATGLGQGLRTFAPAGLEFTEWLKDITERFAKWSNNGGFGAFIAYLQENGPQLLEIARDLGKFLSNVGEAVNGMAPAALTVFGALLKALASFPPGLLQALAYGWIAMSVAIAAYNTVAFISAAASSAALLWLSPMGPLILGIAASVAIWVAALAAVAVGIYFLIKYWDEVWGAIKKTAQVVWGWLKTAWEETWNFIKGVALTVWDFLTHGWGQFLLLFMGPIGLIIAVASHWEQVWGAIKTAATTVWDALKSAWDATVSFIVDKWNAVTGPVRESWSTLWPQLAEAAMNVWSVLKGAWEILWGAITYIWDAFWGAFGGTFKTAWSGAVATATAAWDLLTSAWELVWSVIKGVFDTGWALLSGAWSIGWTLLTESAKIAWALLTGAWSVVWSVVRGIWDTFYAIFSGIFTTAWNTITAIATGIWNVIKAAWDALWKTVTAIFTTFLAIFTGNWGAAWNSIKDAAAAIWNLIKTAWSAFLNVIMTALSGFINTAKAAWSAFWTAVQNTATTFWNAIKNLFQTFLTAVQNLWTTVWTAIRNFFQTLVNAIISIAQAAWTTFRNAVNTFLTGVKSVWDTTWSAIRAFFTTIKDGVLATAGLLWTGIREAFSAGSTWLRTTFWNPVSNFFVKTIPEAFGKATEMLGKAWDKIKKLVRDPIQAVVNVVYNNGIVKLWNLVAGVFGADKLSAFTLPQFREGGPTGRGSSDGFLAKLHPDEHVWTKDEVRAAGGHQAVAQMRSAVLGGKPVRAYGTTSFEDGGGLFGTGLGPDVGPDLVPDGIIKNAYNKLKDVVLGGVYKVIEPPINAAVKLAQSTVRGIIPGEPGLEKLATAIPRKMADTVLNWIKEKDVAPTVAGGTVEGALQWARSQVGKPYQWGGVGPAGYDCSGFMGAIQNVIMGKKPNSRVWATGAFNGSNAPSGWKRSEKAPFMVGITNAGVGHTAGTLNGVNVESAGGVGVRVGASARGYNNGLFTDWYGFLPSKSAGGGTSPAAAQATAKAMMGSFGFASSQWPNLQALWNRESGWRWNADNPTSDAYGIPQALPGSKMASSGADWRTNPRTQIHWGLGYIKGRYGSPSKADAFQKSHNWYASGTPGANSGWATVGERGLERVRFRGGERVDPMRDLIKDVSGGGDTYVTVEIDARGATPAAVDKLQREFPDTLRVALAQGVGRKP
jgi:phage-related protein